MPITAAADGRPAGYVWGSVNHRLEGLRGVPRHARSLFLAGHDCFTSRYDHKSCQQHLQGTMRFATAISLLVALLGVSSSAQGRSIARPASTSGRKWDQQQHQQQQHQHQHQLQGQQHRQQQLTQLQRLSQVGPSSS